MPTADEYLALASRVEGMVGEAREALEAVEAAGPGAVVGGTLAERVARTLSDAAMALKRGNDGLDAVAAAARSRARLCREYTAAMATYRAELATWEAAMAITPWLAAGHHPARPQRPGPWAEEG